MNKGISAPGLCAPNFDVVANILCEWFLRSETYLGIH